MKPLKQRGVSGKTLNHPNNEILKENDNKIYSKLKEVHQLTLSDQLDQRGVVC